MSTLDIVAEILREVAPRALRAKEIAELGAGRLPTASKTPETVVSRDLALEVRDRGDSSHFLRVDRGEFLLKEALPTAFYNDNDAYAAAWTRNLVAAGQVAAGVVDERSIRDLKPADVASYRQCHFFSGIGTWSRALRDAGWGDSVPVWSGSCPCQGFSQAGQKRGFEDERHLWPEWFRLIDACRPPVIFAEQVASKDGLAWLDVILDELERAGYTCRAVDSCASGYGAPHLRQRLYVVAVAGERGWAVVRSARLHDRGQSGDDAARRCSTDLGDSGVVSDSAGARCTSGEDAGADRGDERQSHEANERWSARDLEPQRGGPVDGTVTHGNGHASSSELGNAGLAGSGRDAGEVPRAEDLGEGERIETGGLADEPLAPGAALYRPGDRIRLDGDPTWGGAVGGFWARDVEWIYCRPAPGHQDGRFRPVESCTLPLVIGTAEDLGRTRAKRLRSYGNAIVLPQAVEFISAVIETLAEAPIVAEPIPVAESISALPSVFVNWTGPREGETAPSGILLGRVPGERWPYGPPEAHESACNLFPHRGSKGGLFCDCAASASDAVAYGEQA